MNLKKIKIFVRVDGSHKRGMGHIYRQILLAKEFQKFTKNILFITKNYQVAIDLILENGFEIIKTLPKHISKKDEIKCLSKLIDDHKPHIVIVDVLKTEKNYVLSIKRKNNLLVTFDNTGYGAYHSNIVFNVLYQNISRKKPKDSNVRLYQGEEYIILNPVLSSKKKEIKREVENILITQGGSDTHGFTIKILEAIDEIIDNFNFLVVVGPAFKHKKELNSFLSKAKKKYVVKHNVKNMAKLMEETDIAITAAGTTLYELLCAGVPSIVICNEKFEEETADRFYTQKLVVNLGFGGNVKRKEILHSLENLVKDYTLRENMSSMGKRKIDGKGIERIRKILLSGLIKIT